ncbi:hypothetical protein PInf_012872 [Phytophthora infestans]|nr:hypothetical protein PInf_012872 [Phytophthora infestans]
MAEVPGSSEQPEPEQLAAVDENPVDESANTLSKRAMRREKRRLQYEERKVEKKLKRKEQKRIKNASGLIPPPKELDMSEEAVLRRKERANAKREAYLMAAEEGVKVVIDCEFEEKMTDKEKKSLSQQIMFSYGVNRKSRTPMNVYITSLHGDTRNNLENICGFHEWLAFTESSKSYMDFFKKESLVYLTADSPNIITKLSRDKVYIIGGIVDRNRLKGITYEKAVEQGIETAKLPLDAVVEMGAATRVLTVNHVFEILAQFSEIKDWAQATLATLPSRKGAHSKQE